MAQIGGILRQSKTGGALLKSITLSARNKAWTGVLKSGKELSMGMVRNALEEAFEEALQGTVSELVPKLLRGKEIEGGAKGFLARRGREAGAGALIGGMFSGIGQLGTTAMEAGKAYVPVREEIERFIPEGGEGLQAEEQVDAPGDVDTADDSAYTGEELDEIDFGDEVEADGSTGNQKAAAIGEGVEVDGVEQEIEVDTSTDSERAIDKLNTALKLRGIGKIRKLTEQERTKERGKRAAKGEKAKAEVKKRGGTPQEQFNAARAEMAGELPTATFEELTEEEMSPEDFDSVRNAILDSDLGTFDSANANDALNDLQDGLVPQPAKLALLGEVIGQENATQIWQSLLTKGQKRALFIKNLINFPTTMLATLDISMIGRQGILTLPAHPKEWVKGLKSSYAAFFKGDKWAQMANKEYRTRAGYELGRRSGLFISDFDGSLDRQEELFLSKWAKAIPVFGAMVKASERAAVVGMNQLRTSIFDKTAREWEGTSKTDEDYKQLARIVNMATGRGNITNKKIEGILPYLNVAFFSPRYVASRFEVLGELGLATKEALTKGQSISPARKILAKQAISFLGAGLGVMVLASMIPGVDVEKDPRSSDWGKIKFGRSRADVWAGFQQPLRTLAQFVMGEGKSINSKELYTKNRLETVGRFIQSKLSPVVGQAIEIATGKDFLGQPLPKFENKGEMAGYMISKIAPLIIQDMVEAANTHGPLSALVTGAGAFHGIGMQTFGRTTQDNLTDLRDKFSNEYYQTTWENLGPIAQKLLRQEEPSIVEQEKIAKFERRNASFDAGRQRKAGEAVEKELPKEVMDELDSLSLSVGGLSRTIVRNWRLNAKLYKRYQDDVASRLNEVLPTLISSDAYQDWTPAIKQKMLDFYIRQAKASVRRKIVMDANMSSFEDVRTGVEDD
jgi:hypothetical protein